MPKVLIIQFQVMHYRVPFFAQLYSKLEEDGIELVVAYSPPNRAHALRKDSADLPKEFGCKVKGYWFADRLLYQPLWSQIRSADLVITGNENKYLMNLWLFLLSTFRLKKVALWGLGQVMEEDKSSLANWLREKSVKAANWYFTYTDGSIPFLRKQGMSAERITPVQNAVDTRGLSKTLESINESEIKEARAKIAVSEGPVGIYCGNLDPTKHVPFLISAARLIRQRVPKFQLLIVGDGPDRPWIEIAAKENPWVHYLGPKFGREKAIALRMADVFVLPGRVGLAVLDSFAAGLPLFTTDLAIHGPEVSYLSDRENGRKTIHDIQAYADAVVEALNTPSLMAKLRQGAVAARSRYTIEAMVENFRTGVKRCLDSSNSVSRMV
jgi:glycosyltransferase involved in cell wall biosynthesis